MAVWINPEYASNEGYIRELLENGKEETRMANCSNCGGSGRIIYTDSDGKMKDMACLNCGGSGQK